MSQDINKHVPQLLEIKGGWLAMGEGWAVQATSKDEAVKKFHERKLFYKEIMKRPPIYKTNI